MRRLCPSTRQRCVNIPSTQRLPSGGTRDSSADSAARNSDGKWTSSDPFSGLVFPCQANCSVIVTSPSIALHSHVGRPARLPVPIILPHSSSVQKTRKTTKDQDPRRRDPSRRWHTPRQWQEPGQGQGQGNRQQQRQRQRQGESERLPHARTPPSPRHLHPWRRHARSAPTRLRPSRRAMLLLPWDRRP
jgi:hypothetical protein